MKLIIGGAYQGKLAYAKEAYHRQDGWIDGRTCSEEELYVCGGIFDFHEFVRRMLRGEIKETFDGTDLTKLESWAETFAAQLLENNPEIVIVMNELGYGVVPMDKEERLWREAVGRLGTALAAQAEEVVRIVCGIGMRLK